MKKNPQLSKNAYTSRHIIIQKQNLKIGYTKLLTIKNCRTNLLHFSVLSIINMRPTFISCGTIKININNNNKSK